MGRYASATKAVDERLKMDPNNTSVLILAGQLERELARFDRAQSFLERAVRGQGDINKARLALGELLVRHAQLHLERQIQRLLGQQSREPPQQQAILFLNRQAANANTATV